MNRSIFIKLKPFLVQTIANPVDKSSEIRLSGTKTSQQVDAYMAVIVQTKQDASKTSRNRAVLRLNGGGPRMMQEEKCGK